MTDDGSPADTNDIDLDVRDDPAHSRWIALDGGVEAGLAMYERTADVVTFTHTVVHPQAEGRGVGSALARAALDAARANGDHVVARCEFIARFIDRHREYGDLLA